MIKRKWKWIKYIKVQLICKFEKDRSILHQIIDKSDVFLDLRFDGGYFTVNTFVFLDLEIIMIKRKWKWIKYIKVQLICKFEKDRSILHQIIDKSDVFLDLRFDGGYFTVNTFVFLDLEIIMIKRKWKWIKYIKVHLLCKFEKDWSILHQIIDKNDVFLDLRFTLRFDDGHLHLFFWTWR